MQGFISARAVYDVIEREPKIQTPKKGAVEQVVCEDKISFENITFRYPTQVEGTQDILSGASFSIKAGESTAIVGPSGSGKSTIIQLVQRYYDPLNEGQIKFDNDPLVQLNLEALRKSIGYVG